MGIGNFYFFIDIIVVLCVVEIEVDVILMVKNNVDGVYNVDFKFVFDVVKYEILMYIDVLKDGLVVMDFIVFLLCMDNDILLIVFLIMEEGNIKCVVIGENIGIIVKGK